MKIFHIVSNKEWGGGEQYVYDLAQRQLADGIEVELFCLPVEAVIGKFSQLHVPVHALPLRGVLDLKSAWSMSRIIRKAGGCAIHAHNFKDAFTAAYARKLAGREDVRVVMCRHLTRKGKTSWVYRWLYRELDCLVFDSELSRDAFLSTHPAIDKSKVRVVHTSIVVPDGIVPAPVRQEFDIPSSCVLAMYHGRLDAEKGLDVLIRAAALLREKNFRLLLIGRGSEEYTTHLQQLITAEGLEEKVILGGFRHPVLPYVAASDFGILASVVREGCPLSPQEYMSQGRPVVATDHGGQREYIVHGENGLLVPPGDAETLADAMRKLIDDAALRSRLGQQAQSDFSEKLNYEHFYSLIRKIYEPDC